MLKKTIMLTVILFSVQSEASLRCTWLETKAGAASEAMLMADQASKETFCKIGNQFVKYANDYIRECSGKSNLGIQGSAGIMLNNISIVEQKCQGYNRTISDDAKEWWNKSKNKSSNEGQHKETVEQEAPLKISAGNIKKDQAYHTCRHEVIQILKNVEEFDGVKAKVTYAKIKKKGNVLSVYCNFSKLVGRRGTLSFPIKKVKFKYKDKAYDFLIDNINYDDWPKHIGLFH